MRKYILLVSTLSSLPLLAFYNGNPSLPDMPRENFFLPENSPVSLKSTYEGDFLLARKIHSGGFSSPSIRSHFNGMEISLGFIDRVEIYSLLGFSGLSFHGTQNSQEVKIHTAHSFGGLLGARAIAIVHKDIKLGFDAKYFYGWPHLQSVKLGSDSLNASCRQSSEEQWQVGVSLSQDFAFFTPYIGAKYSRFFLDFTNIFSLGESLHVTNVSPFGVFIGLGISGKKGSFFNFEARFLDEYALAASLGWRW